MSVDGLIRSFSSGGGCLTGLAAGIAGLRDLDTIDTRGRDDDALAGLRDLGTFGTLGRDVFDLSGLRDLDTIGTRCHLVSRKRKRVVVHLQL